MKKTLLLLVILSSIVFNGLAQSRYRDTLHMGRRDSAQIKANDLMLAKHSVRLSIDAEYGLATGRAAAIYGSVLGGSLKLELPVSPSKFYITLTGGFTGYVVKLDYTGTLTGLKPAYYVPAELGGKIFVSKYIYFEGDAGASFNLSSYYTEAKTAFIYAPVIGVSAPTSKHKAFIDLSLRYEGRVESGGTIGQAAVRLAYKFAL